MDYVIVKYRYINMGGEFFLIEAVFFTDNQ